MNRNVMIRISALALAMISIGATAQAATVTKFKLRDRSLIANLFYADECNIATTSVRFAESVTQTDGVREVSPPTTTVEVDYTNGCTGESFTLTGGTAVQTVHFAGDFSTATLSAVVPLNNEDGVTVSSVTLNLVWTANAPLQEAKDKTRTRDGNVITVEKFDFKSRSADISGTAPTTLPTNDGPLSIDLALSSQGGTIGKDVLGDRTVTKKH
ncbi:MAG: hypothetical protein JWM82_4065 [Myxococcales bacterium]|nr:hypothetical protein [Myxococcales bacterium]